MGSAESRECVVKITNKSKYTLSRPRVYVYHGYYDAALPPTLSRGDSGQALFKKTAHRATGAVGVFTYELDADCADKDVRKVAVMFSVPFDFNFYENWFAVGVFDKLRNCDHHLYEEMYYYTQSRFVRGSANGERLTHSDDDVNISATMTDTYQPTLVVELS
ncbi:cytolysin Src-1-like isoform X2 [Stegastes partitus]|uniref:Cytolysin Src-1-like n=1 Tax=Stegastes partitus TaxID=144197 RepID=A0A3B5B3P7_9TELE|nr:PREDICTED: cytolysin Src-1-like isoform X2 [Stegastes partitus]XP_008293035.1 PREDICTED: cytolysin Src-1-like isoform X2 [Stegastes partitus]XP_008293036.1 PREDICTED: cytolysin Src-1-like isoform X2 [Stegastes partitus]